MGVFQTYQASDRKVEVVGFDRGANRLYWQRTVLLHRNRLWLDTAECRRAAALKSDRCAQRHRRCIHHPFHNG